MAKNPPRHQYIDQGFVLVQACVAAGLAVEVLPGPSAALAALVASALPAETWRFAGFLPRKRSGLVEAFSGPETLVAVESPKRVAAFKAVLESKGVHAYVRRPRGRDIYAACGQLAARREAAPPALYQIS